jgi:hypothetical protein
VHGDRNSAAGTGDRRVLGIGQAAGLALVDAGPGADWVCTLGRIGPALVFDKQIRTRNRLAS